MHHDEGKLSKHKKKVSQKIVDLWFETDGKLFPGYTLFAKKCLEKPESYVSKSWWVTKNEPCLRAFCGGQPILRMGSLTPGVLRQWTQCGISLKHFFS